MSSVTMVSPLEQIALQETYEDVKRLIYCVVHKYVRRTGIPFEDLLSVAHTAFAKAYRDYDPKHRKGAKFSSYLVFRVNNNLRTYISEDYQHTKNSLEINEEICGTEDHNNYRFRIESELISDDARTIIKLVLDVPSDMSTLMRWNNVRTRRGFLKTLQEHLEDLGWTLEQIQSAFDEIKTVVSR